MEYKNIYNRNRFNITMDSQIKTFFRTVFNEKSHIFVLTIEPPLCNNQKNYEVVNFLRRRYYESDVDKFSWWFK